jgi:hypothetical protein
MSNTHVSINNIIIIIIIIKIIIIIIIITYVNGMVLGDIKIEELFAKLQGF